MTKPSSQLVGTPDAALQFTPFVAPASAQTTSNVLDLGGIGPRARVVISEAFSTLPAGYFAEVALDASSTANFASVYEVGRVRFGDDPTMPRSVRGTVALAFDLAHVGDGSTIPENLRFVRLRAVCGVDVELGVGGSITAETFA